MGLFTEGEPLPWRELEQRTDQVKEHAVKQLVNLWEQVKDRKAKEMLWGDEIEYMVISFDEENKNARLSLRQCEVLEALKEEREGITKGKSSRIPSFHPEYGRYMLESTPGEPYGGSLEALLEVEDNMRMRRRMAQSKLKAHESPITLTSYPRLGVSDVFLDPHVPVHGHASSVSNSAFLPDEVMNPHVRYRAATQNLRERRASKMHINVPVFRDSKTPAPFIDLSATHEPAAKAEHIFMDAAAFGAGCCCLQVTMQMRDLREARRLYDALIPIAPVVLALTAATPAFKGYLSDLDCRWNAIVDALDDRKTDEQGGEASAAHRPHVDQARYGGVTAYLSPDKANRSEYNDVRLKVDERQKAHLKAQGMDGLLAGHFAQVLVHDPVLVFSNQLEPDDKSTTESFDSIQSLVWQILRLKLPPLGSEIGWRVEFRSMEVQVADHDNAAFAIFVVLLSRAILALDMDFYLPISKVQDNMERAQQRDACRKQTLWFRDIQGTSQYCEMTLDEVVNGRRATERGHEQGGLLGIIRRYLGGFAMEPDARVRLDEYLQVVADRAQGKTITNAQWIREFIRTHPDYCQDSVISREVNYDLMKAMQQMNS